MAVSPLAYKAVPLLRVRAEESEQKRFLTVEQILQSSSQICDAQSNIKHDMINTSGVNLV
jgi:hypothetical protein